MADSPTNPFWERLVKLIDAAPSPAFLDEDGNALLQTPRAYRGSVPADDQNRYPKPGYFLLGSGPELPGGYYNSQVGVDGRYTVHCWADTQPNANRLYNWLRGLIEAALGTGSLAVAGHVVGDLSITKGTEAPDPTEGAWQVPMYLDVELLAVA